MRRRLTHLSELDGFQTTDSPGYAEWSERRLDRWLVDWNLRTGKEATAKTIARARGIEVSPPSGRCAKHADLVVGPCRS